MEAVALKRRWTITIPQAIKSQKMVLLILNTILFADDHVIVASIEDELQIAAYTN